MTKYGNINSNSGPLLTTRQAVESWGISKWTLQEMVRRGEIKRVMGLRTKEHRFRPDAFEKFLKIPQGKAAVSV